MLFQGVQYGFSIPVLIAGVEGEVEDFFIGILRVKGVILGQFLHSGIPGRRLSVFLKAQSPAAFSRCGDRTCLCQMMRNICNLTGVRRVGRADRRDRQRMTGQISRPGSEDICGKKK